MEFRILGPLEISDNGHTLALGGGRQFALVGLLLVHRNTVVPTDQIVEELWQGSPPPTASKIVRNTVSLLRKELGDRLVTRSPGYMLRVEPGELDSARLEQAVADGRPEALAGALALWRGSPLAQVAYYDFARAEIDRLEELHLSAIETRIDADLEQGRHAAVAPELEALTHAYPLRERFLEQLMLALYRSGRQADALETYRQARRALDAELGLEPSRHLQELERKILTQDPALDAPTPPSRTPVAPRRRGGLLIALGAAALLAAGIAAGALALTSGGETKSLAHVAANSVGVIDPKSNRIVAQIPVGAAPSQMALTDDSLWVVNSADESVSRIDPARRVVVRTIAIPGDPGGIGADDSGAWLVYRRSRGGGYVDFAGAAFIDARFNDVKQLVSLSRLFDPSGLFALAPGAAWMTGAGFVLRLDPSTGRLLRTIRVSPVGAAGFEAESGIDIGEGGVWVIGSADVVRIDPQTGGIVARIPIAQNATGGPPNPTAIAVGEGAVWVASRRVAFSSISGGQNSPVLRGTVSRIDPKTNAVVATIPVGADPFGIAVGEGSVWVANRRGFSISRIDPRTNEVVASIPIGNRPQGIAAGHGAVWVSVS
jgi:YVTN family beta-propeller protein